MAGVLSGSVATPEMMGRSITLSWTATQNVTGNYSTVSWRVYGTGSDTQNGIMVREVSAQINGSSVYYTANLATLVHYNDTIATGSVKINHNSSGAASFVAYIGAGIYYQWAINAENSQTFTLKTIDRGIAHISNGSSFSQYQCYISNGSSFSVYAPYIYTSSGWVLY